MQLTVFALEFFDILGKKQAKYVENQWPAKTD